MDARYTLEELREEIDLIDSDIIAKLAKRMEKTRAVMRIKEQAKLPARDKVRERVQRQWYTVQARVWNIDEKMVNDVFAALHDAAIAQFRHQQ